MEIIVCYSRCLWCGRRTPHEVCHAHATELGFDPAAGDADALWGTGRDLDDEECADPACPVWEPGEWERRQRRAAMTPEERRAEVERINAGIEARRAEYERARS